MKQTTDPNKIINHHPLDEDDLQKLRDVFRRYSDIRAVYLFGSVVEGRSRPDSDLDMAIVPGDPSLRERRLDILADLAEAGFCEVDLVFMDVRDVVLRHEAVRQNCMIYQTNDFDRGEMYSRVVREYLDFLPYLKVQREAYKRRILSGQNRSDSQEAQQTR